VDSPKLNAELVTDEGVRCVVNDEVLDFQSLAAVVAERVNDSLRQRAAALLKENESVPFGPLSVSADGLVIGEPRPRPFPRNVGDFLDRFLFGRLLVRPGHYGWKDVDDICTAKTKQGTITYYQLEIRHAGRGAKIFVCRIPDCANFAVLCEVLAMLGHPVRTGK
jgi:hypothetical protein